VSVIEKVILIDEGNRRLGSAEKLHAHRAGLLHRAFSVFLVDDKGRVLLQRRSPEKYHSGGLWANSCCGHPRPNERTLQAAQRRVREELGTTSQLRFGFRTRYRAEFDNGLIENEIVYVFFGGYSGRCDLNPHEVSEIKFCDIRNVASQIESGAHEFAYWLKHYMTSHREALSRWVQQDFNLPGGAGSRRTVRGPVSVHQG
jgi:isopentenyl-diphosphate delta-isomerase